MRIMNFIKNYPVTVITIIFLLSGILGILIQGKVYAMSEKANTPGCNCGVKPCNPGDTNTYPGGTVPCERQYYYENQKCVCLTNEIFTGDPYDVMSGVWEICKGKRTGTGCICNIPCEEYDCNPQCPNRCNITTYRMYCKQNWIDAHTRYECLYCYYEGDNQGHQCTDEDCH